MGVVGEKSLEREGEGLGDWGGLADIDVSEEAETGVGGSSVELMGTVLSVKISIAWGRIARLLIELVRPERQWIKCKTTFMPTELMEWHRK